MQPPSALDDLLATDDCTLEAVLDEENVVDELRSNRALLDFLVRQENLNQLISLVVEEPPEDLEESVRYKRPHVACNLFSLDQNASNTLADNVVADECLLDKLWSFLEQPAPLNPLLASFFSRVMMSILQRKTPLMIEYLCSKEAALEQLLKHIDTSAIMDLILGLLSACETSQLRHELVQWFRDAQLVQMLVALVHPSIDEDKQRNAARALSEMIRLCYEHLARTSEVLHSDQLLDVLEHDDTIQQLVRNMLADTSSGSPIVRGLQVLQSMLSLQQGLSDQTINDSPAVANEEAARQVVASLTPWLGTFHRLLLEPPSANPVATTVGVIKVPLGATRLSVVQLLVLCIQTNVPEFLQEFIRLNVGASLLDLFFEFAWNNFLHTQVEQLVVYAFGSKIEGEGTPENSLPLSLLATCNMMDRLAIAALDNEQDQNSQGGKRRGYMGHVISMCNAVLQAIENDEQIATQAAALTNEEDCAWRVWVEGGLTAANERNNTQLGGQQPIDDDMEEIFPEPMISQDSIQQSFLNYQSQQLSTEFADNFGFNEEDLTSEEAPVTAPYEEACGIDFELMADLRSSEEDLFKSCVEATIKQYEDVPNSDEIWSESNDQTMASEQSDPER